MKRALLLAVAVVVLFAQCALAHPPSAIEITYDPTQKLVTAVIAHQVDDPAAHNIAKVEIYLNGQLLVTYQIILQENKDTQTVIYRLPDAAPGSIVTVTAHCRISGVLTQEMPLP